MACSSAPTVPCAKRGVRWSWRRLAGWALGAALPARGARETIYMRWHQLASLGRVGTRSRTTS
eukprot:1139150-Pelagomonas_calceolata.AAC.3